MNHNDNTGGPKIIRLHGGYRDLKSYQMAEIVHDATVVFCDRFVDRRSRTHDQLPAKAGKWNEQIMVQAARRAGGRADMQNIAEGCMAFRHFQENRIKAGRGGAGQSGRAASGLPGLPPAVRPAPVG